MCTITQYVATYYATSCSNIFCSLSGDDSKKTNGAVRKEESMPVDIESQVLFVISELLMSVLIVNDCSYIIKRLEKQFSSLQRKLLSEMKSNTPETLLDSMPQLPVALQGEYRKFSL